MLQPLIDTLRAVQRRLAVRVLIIEDDPVVAGFVAHRIREADDLAKVRHVTTADRALELMDRGLYPHLVLLDWLLPVGRSAVAFLAQIEALPEPPPVIILTGAPEEARAVVGDRYPIVAKTQLGAGGGFLAIVERLMAIAGGECDEETCATAAAARQRVTEVETRARERLEQLGG